MAAASCAKIMRSKGQAHRLIIYTACMDLQVEATASLF